MPSRHSRVGVETRHCTAAGDALARIWLDSLLLGIARRQVLARRRDRAVATTTLQNHAGVLQNVIDPLELLPARVLVTLGGSIEAGELRGSHNCAIVDSARR